MFVAKRVSELEDSIIRRFSNMAKEKDDISLAMGEPCFSTAEAIKEETIKALKDNDTHYAPCRGKQTLINRISVEEKCSQGEVLVTAGSSSGLTVGLFTLLNPDDDVLIPIPTYSHYPPVVSLALGKSVFIDTSENNFQLSKQLLQKHYTNKTKLLVINTPQNPTGIVYTEESLKEIVEFVKTHDIYLMLDAVYDLLQFDNRIDYQTLMEIKDRLIICKSFSKAYFMTGWRLGYIIAPQNLIKQMSKVHSYFATAVNSFTQTAALKAFDLDLKNEYTIIKQNRDIAYEAIKAMKLPVVKPTGGFYIFPCIKEFRMDSKTFCELLYLKTGVATVPGIAFFMDGYIRISFCCWADLLTEGLARMHEFINNLRTTYNHE